MFTPDPQDLKPKANLAPGAWEALRIGWMLKGDIRGRDAKRLCRDLFRYCVAIAHAPQYETDHKDSLAQDWPHIPINKVRAEFEKVVELGDQIAQLLNPFHKAAAVVKAILGSDANALVVPQKVGGGNLKESDLTVDFSYYGAGAGRWEERAIDDGEVQREQWGETTGNLYLSKSVFLKHVPRAIWQYELGGYPVIKKWLGYRQATKRNGTPLSLGELDELREIALRIATLLTIRPLLDKAYEAASGNAWAIGDFSA